MTTEEAIKIINKAIIESENVIAELSKIKALAERKSMVGEYYANIQNSEQEIEACKVAIEDGEFKYTRSDEAIAWSPLPEPYHPERRDAVERESNNL